MIGETKRPFLEMSSILGDENERRCERRVVIAVEVLIRRRAKNSPLREYYSRSRLPDDVVNVLEERKRDPEFVKTS